MYPTLLDAVTTRSDSRYRAAEQAGAVLFVTVLTAIAAQISVPLPFTPVPFTFQPMVVLVGAAALGSRLGMFSQVLYLALVAHSPKFTCLPAPMHAVSGSPFARTYDAADLHNAKPIAH